MLFGSERKKAIFHHLNDHRLFPFPAYMLPVPIHRGLLEILALKMTNATAKSLQSCPTLCDPIDGSPPGSPVPGILQARTLEWVAISFSTA